MAKAWSKNIILDPGTFGGTKACHVLVEMMNQDVIPVFEKHRVLSFINKAIYAFNSVSSITDSGIRYKAMVMMKDHYLNRVDQMNYPIKFLQFLKNVLSHHSRRALESQAMRDKLTKKYFENKFKLEGSHSGNRGR